VKTKFVWFLSAFVMVLLLPLCCAQASFLDDIMGNNSGHTQTYTYSVTHSGQPQNNGAVQYGGPGTYTAAPKAPLQPVGKQVAAPQVAYQQPILHAQEIPQQRTSSKAVAKKKANGVRSAKAQPAVRRQPAATANAYQQNYPAQRPGVTQPPSYGQTQQASYYTNPYQVQYTASPSYYQGYYGNRNASPQACPPGRA
jgi:hypothetical protein